MGKLQRKHDLREEKRAAKKFARAFGWEPHKYAGDYGTLDTVFLREGELRAIAEVKRRYHRSNQYPTVYASLRKTTDLMTAMRVLDQPAYYVWQFDDRLGFWAVKTYKGKKIEVLGRFDRGYDNDKEPILHIPLESLLWIGVDEEISNAQNPVQERDDDAAQRCFKEFTE